MAAPSGAQYKYQTPTALQSQQVVCPEEEEEAVSQTPQFPEDDSSPTQVAQSTSEGEWKMISFKKFRGERRQRAANVTVDQLLAKCTQVTERGPVENPKALHKSTTQKIKQWTKNIDIMEGKGHSIEVCLTSILELYENPGSASTVFHVVIHHVRPQWATQQIVKDYQVVVRRAAARYTGAQSANLPYSLSQVQELPCSYRPAASSKQVAF